MSDIKQGFPPGFDPFAPSGETTKLHTPNSFSIKERIERSLLAVALLAYGTFGVYKDDLYMPGKYGRGIHLHGTSAWILYAAMLCGAAVLASVVIDHYDRRNNEHKYLAFQRYTKVLGWTLFGASMLNSIARWVK